MASHSESFLGFEAESGARFSIRPDADSKNVENGQKVQKLKKFETGSVEHVLRSNRGC